jgi:uncharacterized membrane protein
VALTTPLLQALGRPAYLPPSLAILLWGEHPLVPFPLLPWVSYTLTGCCVGAYFIRGAAAGTLGRTVLFTALIGATIAIVGKIGGRIDIPIYRPTLAVPIPATPVSYLFRTGTCLVGLAFAYWLDLRRLARAANRPAGAPSTWSRFAPLHWLGQASMTVYMVHLDLVYNIWSYPIKQKLGPWVATGLLAALTAAMVWLAWYKTARTARPRPRPISPARTLAPA